MCLFLSGTLQEGDELLSANGESLQKCNNDRAVAVLRHASQTGMVCITYQRDEKSRYEKSIKTYRKHSLE